jgi:hypothetical protein
MAQRFEQFQQGEFMQDIVDQPAQDVKLLIDTDFGSGNEGTLGPETVSDRNSVMDAAKPRYIEQMRAERWFCMDDGLEELGGQLPGGIMITEAAGETMNGQHRFERQSELVAVTTRELVEGGIEVWVHGDTQAGKAGCAANKYWRDILRTAGRNADVIGPTVWAVMTGVKLDHATKRGRIREFIEAGAEQAENDSFWDITAEELADIAVANGAKYHELDRTHKTAFARFDLTDNIFNNFLFRSDHKTEDGLPLGAFSMTFGAYKNNLIPRAEKHGYEEVWLADKMMQAAIFSAASSKKLGSPVAGHQLRLAVVGTRH